MTPAASASRWFRFNLWLHRWTGLLATVPFLVLCLHNFLGVVVLGWALVVTLTGFLLGFGPIAQLTWQMTELSALEEELAGEPVDPRQPPTEIDRAVTAAQTGAPPGWCRGT